MYERQYYSTVFFVQAYSDPKGARLPPDVFGTGRQRVNGTRMAIYRETQLQLDGFYIVFLFSSCIDEQFRLFISIYLSKSTRE